MKLLFSYFVQAGGRHWQVAGVTKLS